MLKRYLALHAQGLVSAAGRIARQPGGALLTVLVIGVALALPGGLRVLVSNADALSGSWDRAADFSAYLALGVADERARALAKQIGERPDVAAVELITPDAALAEFRKRSGMGAAVDALPENPLPHTLVIRPASGAAGDVEALAAAIAALDDVELVQLDTEWVQRLRAILALAGRVVDIATALLGAAVVVVMGNTIRLEIQNRRAEIEVTKLVGGTDGFIRRPFLYLGLCYGVLGGLAALLVISATLALLGEPVSDLAGLYGSDYRLTGLSAAEAAALLGGGALLGWAGAWLATARHLREIEPK
ncbi:MAG TPA: permease-like cell division protein FtsX [Gammaproteobacteria bacterium]